MSDTYIPPFPTGNSSSEANYTQAFEKARQNRNKQTGPTEPEPVKPKTPQHHHSAKPKHVKPSYSLNNQGSGSSKSGSSHNGSSRSGSSNNGSSKPRSSNNSNNKSGNPSYSSHLSPKPARSGREKKEGQIGNYSTSPYNNKIGYNSPYNNNNSPNNNAGRRNEQGRSKKKQGGQSPLQDGILPPFPTGTDTGSNYTEMFNRYHKDNMSPNAPAVQPYHPANEIPTHKTRCCCIL